MALPYREPGNAVLMLKCVHNTISQIIRIKVSKLNRQIMYISEGGVLTPPCRIAVTNKNRNADKATLLLSA